MFEIEKESAWVQFEIWKIILDGDDDVGCEGERMEVMEEMRKWN